MVINMAENVKIQPSEIFRYAEELLKPEDIDHHGSDLYLRVTPESKALIESFQYKQLVMTFRSNIEPYDIWYELPFCYIPYWEGTTTGGNEHDAD